VPDHQEVYMCADTNACAIIEVVEGQGHVGNKEAAAYFWGDLVDANGATDTQHFETLSGNDRLREAAQSLMRGSGPFGSVISYVDACSGVQVMPESVDDRARAAMIFLGILRLPGFESEIIITVSVPLPSLDDKEGCSRLVARGADTFFGLIESLRINNWAIFGSGDDDDGENLEGPSH
jgi:hypothetical protein